MEERAYEVAFDCKTPKCEEVVVESEWATKEDAETHLRSHRKMSLECDRCRRTYQYAPADDGAFVRPKPTQQERLQVF